MTASGHSRGDGFRKADGTGSRLGFGRGNDLEDVCPVDMIVGIGGLGGIRAGRRNDESVISVNEPGFVDGVVPGAGSPGRVTPCRSVIAGVVGVVAGRGRVI